MLIGARPAMALLLGMAVCANRLPATQVVPQNATNDSLAILGDSLYFAGEPGEALRIFDSAFVSGSGDARIRWRATRAAIAVGMLRTDVKERLALYDAALVHARAGLALAPDSLESRYWLAAAAGRRAYKEDPVYTGRLALELHEQVTAILAADSMHAGAHHALGMLHAEILRTPRLIRFIAARVLRVDAAKNASWPRAEWHMKRATELDTAMVQYLVDLAQLYIDRGRIDEARGVMARLSTTPSRHPMDGMLRQRRSLATAAVVSGSGN